MIEPIPLELCDSGGYQTEADAPPEGRTDVHDCYQNYDSGTSCESRLVVCQRDPASLRCDVIVVGRAATTPSHTSYLCEGEDDERVVIEMPPEQETDPERAPFSLHCDTADPAHVQCERVSGTDGETLVGDHALDALPDVELLLTDLRADDEQDAADEEDE